MTIEETLHKRDAMEIKINEGLLPCPFCGYEVVALIESRISMFGELVHDVDIECSACLNVQRQFNGMPADDAYIQSILMAMNERSR